MGVGGTSPIAGSPQGDACAPLGVTFREPAGSGKGPLSPGPFPEAAGIASAPPRPLQLAPRRGSRARPSPARTPPPPPKGPRRRAGGASPRRIVPSRGPPRAHPPEPHLRGRWTGDGPGVFSRGPRRPPARSSGPGPPPPRGRAGRPGPGERAEPRAGLGVLTTPPARAALGGPKGPFGTYGPRGSLRTPEGSPKGAPGTRRCRS